MAARMPANTKRTDSQGAEKPTKPTNPATNKPITNNHFPISFMICSFFVKNGLVVIAITSITTQALVTSYFCEKGDKKVKPGKSIQEST